MGCCKQQPRTEWNGKSGTRKDRSSICWTVCSIPTRHWSLSHYFDLARIWNISIKLKLKDANKLPKKSNDSNKVIIEVLQQKSKKKKNLIKSEFNNNFWIKIKIISVLKLLEQTINNVLALRMVAKKANLLYLRIELIPDSKNSQLAIYIYSLQNTKLHLRVLALPGKSGMLVLLCCYNTHGKPCCVYQNQR